MIQQSSTTVRLIPLHPGEILGEDFLKPMGLSQNYTAKEMGVDPGRINQIVKCERSITPDTALRLARFLGTSVWFWMGLQMDYDLDVAHDKSGEQIEREVRPLQHQRIS